MKQFLHLPLEDRAIRLLAVSSSKEEDARIVLQIQQFPADDCPRYSALSYRWGVGKQTMNIVASGEQFQVQENLHLFLHHFRKKDSICKDHRWLWIDAICINQNDVEERGAQVQRMDDIYSNAQCVIAWLGGPNERANRAFEIAPLSTRKTRWARWRGEKPSSEQIFADLHALGWLFKEIDYWDRIWIVQEIVLAKDVIFMCGDSIMGLERLKGFFLALDREDGYLKWLDEKIPRRAAPNNLGQLMYHLQRSNAARVFGHRAKHGSEQDQHTTLRTLLERYRVCKSSDPHDKVYALQSLIRPTEMGVKVDYKKNVVELLVEVLRVSQDQGSLTPRDTVGFGTFLSQQLQITCNGEAYSLASQMRSDENLLDVRLSMIRRGLFARPVTEASVKKAKAWNTCQTYADFLNREHWGKGWDSGTGFFLRQCAVHASRLHSEQLPAFQERHLTPGEDHILRSESCTSDREMRATSSFQDTKGPLFFIGLENNRRTKLAPRPHRSPDIIGMAEHPVDLKDEIWQFEGTETAFIVRPTEHGCSVKGRALIAMTRALKDDWNPVTGEACSWSYLDATISSTIIGKTRTFGGTEIIQPVTCFAIFGTRTVQDDSYTSFGILLAIGE